MSSVNGLGFAKMRAEIRKEKINTKNSSKIRRFDSITRRRGYVVGNG